MTDQPTLSGMPKKLFSCTPSRLAAFDCPRRYRFTYIDRPTPVRGASWAHNTVGSVAHLALASWWSLPLVQRTPDAGAQAVVRNWTTAGFRDEEQSARHRAITAGWVRRYLQDVDPAREPVGVERTVGAPVGRLAISGRIDRVDLRTLGGQTTLDDSPELVIVDYKTGRRGISDHEARSSLALALYVLAARRTLRRGCTRVELHHLPTGHVAGFTHTDESLTRHVTRAEATADDIQTATDTLESGADADDVFPAAPGPGCSWCDFRAHCAQGRESSTAIEPWAGLAEDP